jgi:hypothetical protein
MKFRENRTLKKLVRVEECFDRLQEGCLIIPALPYDSLQSFGIDIASTDRQSEKLFAVELRTRDREPQQKFARFLWLPSKKDYYFACFLQDTSRYEMDDHSEVWI